MKINKGTIIFDETDWLSGLHPQYSTSTSNSQKLTNKLSSTKNFNPYRYMGYAAPGFSPTDITNVSIVDAVIRKIVVNNSNAYAISQGTLLHKIDTLSGNGSLVTPTTFPHTIAAHGGHTTVVGNDVVVYPHKVGGTSATRLMYSWSDNTDWDVGTFDYTTTFDDDFMSTAPATPLAAPYLAGGVGKPHPLIVGSDDILYIGDRNFLHGYDGQNAADNDGKFFPAVLTLPVGYIIQSMARIENFLVIFAYMESAGSSEFYLGRATAFFWNYLDLEPTRVVELNDNYVDAAFEYKGTVGCFTQGRTISIDSIATRPSKLQLFNGDVFEPVAYFVENIPITGGVEVRGDIIQWNSQGVLYSYGTPFKGTAVGLQKIASGSGSTAGALATVATTLQLMSTGTTTSGGLQRLNSNYASSSIAATSMAEPQFNTKMKGQVERVRVFFAKTSSGGRNFTLVLLDRLGTSSTIISSADSLTSITASNYIQEFENNTSGNPLFTFDGLKAVLEWESGSAATDAPIVTKIEIDYKEVDLHT